jgi:hypothetical protein
MPSRGAAPPPLSVAAIAIVALAFIVAVMAAAVLLRLDAVPADVLDGLTSPARFGPRTS